MIADAFPVVAERIDAVDGWLTVAQARRLWEAARAVDPPATVVEIGSYHGRSTIVLASAAAPGVTVVAIDPYTGDHRGPHEIRGGSSAVGERDRRTFLSNLARAGVTDRVRPVRRRSQEALDTVAGPVDLLFIDGAHRFGPARADIAGWGTRLREGGAMLIHDSFSAVGVTLAQMRLLLFSDRFRFVGRTGSLSEYRRVDLTGRHRAANAVRQAAQLAYFARNLAVKVALVARLRPVARLLGSRSWPY